MSLQTTTFSWGSYEHKSESNAYVLELSLTEESTSQENNDSTVNYTLKLKSGIQNRFQSEVTSTLKLNGVTVASNTESKYLDYSSEWTLLTGTTTVKHDSDGSLNMPIQVSIDTSDTNPYAPPDTTQNWTWQLTQIILPSACIDNGTELARYLAYIDNGTSWDTYMPYKDNGTSWDRST